MAIAEKNGFRLYIEGTWMEISNKYGVLEACDVDVNPEDIEEGFAEKKLEKYIAKRTVQDIPLPGTVKKVAYDLEKECVIQLQAVIQEGEEYYTLQIYDDELVFREEIWTGCKYKDEVTDWMKSNYEIFRALSAEVFRSGLGDCTNGGISSTRKELYILGSDGPFEPSDIRECVTVERKEVCGQEYLNAKPAYFPRRWYMMGGNFLYTSDSRYREYTGMKYPIPIHDRHEGRE